MWKRTMLSVVSIAFPTSLLIIFLFVTFRLRGIMYTTWLGQFVAMEVGTMHYIAMGVALLIAILTTTEIIWQNVSERQSEIAVLKALGWQNKNIRLLVLLEGGLSGLMAGIIGLGLAFVIIWRMYGQFPSGELFFLCVTLLIPIITGIIAAVLPAERAVKIQPYQGLQGNVSNSKKVEKRFKYAFGIAGGGLIVAVLTLLILSLPDNKEHNIAGNRLPSKEDQTVGNVTEVFNSLDDKLKKSVSKNKYKVDKIKASAWRTGKLGEQIDLMRDGAETFTFGNIGKQLSSVKKDKDENKLISIPITFERKVVRDELSGIMEYYPSVYKLIDGEGNEYSVKDMETIEKKGWNGVYIKSPGIASVLLTFEIPKDADNLILVMKNNSFAGDIVVEVK
jgi:hypothetical protein